MADIMKDVDLEKVTGGWQYANGPYINHGSFIIYTVVQANLMSPLYLIYTINKGAHIFW